MRKQSFTHSAAFRAAYIALLFTALLGTTAAHAQREKTSPPPSATPDSPTLGAYTASTAPGDAAANGKEVAVPRKLLWRVHIYERAFRRVKTTTAGKTADPPTADPAVKPDASPADAPEPPATESAPPTTATPTLATSSTPPVPMVKASFGVQVENDSPYELTALTIELQIIGKDGKSQSVRREISLRNAKTGEPLIAFPPTPVGAAPPTPAMSTFNSPTEIPADFFKDGYKGYWMIVRGARGIHHRYSTNAGKALVEAAMRDDAPIAGRILKARPKVITVRDDKGADMMQVATENESSDVIPILLSRGALVDSLTADRQTPLMLAANADLTRVVKVLIAGHANLNYQEPSTGNTALHLTTTSTGFDSTGARVAMIRLLLKAFADPKIKNKEGKTPLDLTGDPKVREALMATVPSALPPPAGASAVPGKNPPPANDGL